jgi:limonene-1,2-epoxide hydrolase
LVKPFETARRGVSDIEIATRFLEAMSWRDFETAKRLFAGDAEVVAPDGTTSAAGFLQGVRELLFGDNPVLNAEVEIVEPSPETR